MTLEQRIASSAACISTIIVILVGALLHAYELDSKYTATFCTLLAIILISISIKLYRTWDTLLLQLTNYVQLLRQGEHNNYFHTRKACGRLADLQLELSKLNDALKKARSPEQSVETVIENTFEKWPTPVCYFDEDLLLKYSNSAMHEEIRGSFLRGTSAFSLGFEREENQLKHRKFGEGWHCQTLAVARTGEIMQLFIAQNIAEPLRHSQSKAQQDLVRVLAHELRNSLTPVYSMTDTLLSTNSDYDEQTVNVLTRINERSRHLLRFIDDYSLLSKLPPPDKKWLDFLPLINDSKTGVLGDNELETKGSKKIYGDAAQISLLLTNLIKNSKDACKDNCKITLSLYFIDNHQHLEISDNGPGFSNFDNILTPFYTTKKNGSGIGLPMCASITNNHDGKIEVENSINGGATIKITWPTKG